MEVIEILREASNRIYKNVKDLAGTEEAAGDFGRGAGGDISRNIDITAEQTVLDYLKEINFECIVLVYNVVKRLFNVITKQYFKKIKIKIHR